MLRRPRSIGALALTATWLVAACSGGAAPSPSPVAEATQAPTAAPSPTPSPAPTAEPTPTPEPTPDLQAIGAAYLALAEGFAATAQPLIDQIADGGSYTADDWGQLHQDVADAYGDVIAGLDQIEFPATLQDEVAQMRALWVDTQGLFQEVADDPAVDNWDGFVDNATAYGAIADVIRSELGLPPRPTPAG